MTGQRDGGPGEGRSPAPTPAAGDPTRQAELLAALGEGLDPLMLLERAGGPGTGATWPGRAWQVAYANREMARLLRGPPAALLGVSLDELFSGIGSGLRGLVPDAAHLMARARPFRVDLPFRAEELRWLEAQLTPLRLRRGGPVTHWLAVLRDVTAHRQALSLASGHTRAMRLAAQDAPLSAILGALTATLDERLPGSAASAALWEGERLRVLGPPRLSPPGDGWRLTPREARALSCGRAVLEARAVLSLTPAGFPAAVRAELVGAGYRRAYSVPIREADGPVLGSLTLFGRRATRPYGAEVELLRQFADLAALLISRGQAQRRLEHLAFRDGLTGLANRARFMSALEDACARLGGPEPSAAFAVGILDLDGFKRVNDAHGHAAGDQVLAALAGRLTAALPEGVLLARMGGDEFALLVPRVTPARLRAVERGLRSAFGAPVSFGAAQARLGGSLGWSLAPREARTPDALLRRADVAMYAAKRQAAGGLNDAPSERQAVGAETLEPPAYGFEGRGGASENT